MILSFFKIYLLDGIGIFFAIAPVIAVVSRIKKGYWLALIFTVIYSLQDYSQVYPMFFRLAILLLLHSIFPAIILPPLEKSLLAL